MTETPVTGISEACDKMGGQEALADALGVSQPAVSKWVAKGFAPFPRVPAIADLTGVSRKRLVNPQLVALIED